MRVQLVSTPHAWSARPIPMNLVSSRIIDTITFGYLTRIRTCVVSCNNHPNMKRVCGIQVHYLVARVVFHYSGKGDERGETTLVLGMGQGRVRNCDLGSGILYTRPDEMLWNRTEPMSQQTCGHRRTFRKQKRGRGKRFFSNSPWVTSLFHIYWRPILPPDRNSNRLWYGIPR